MFNADLNNRHWIVLQPLHSRLIPPKKYYDTPPSRNERSTGQRESSFPCVSGLWRDHHVEKRIFKKKLFPDIPPGHGLIKDLLACLFGHQADNDHGNHSNDKRIERKMHG